MQGWHQAQRVIKAGFWSQAQLAPKRSTPTLDCRKSLDSAEGASAKPQHWGLLQGSYQSPEEHLTSSKISAWLHQFLSLQNLTVVQPALYQGQSPGCALPAAKAQIPPAGPQPPSDTRWGCQPPPSPCCPAEPALLPALLMPFSGSFTPAFPCFFGGKRGCRACHLCYRLLLLKMHIPKDPGLALSRHACSASPSVSLVQLRPVSFLLASSGT